MATSKAGNSRQSVFMTISINRLSYILLIINIIKHTIYCNCLDIFVTLRKFSTPVGSKRPDYTNYTNYNGVSQRVNPDYTDYSATTKNYKFPEKLHFQLQ